MKGALKLSFNTSPWPSQNQLDLYDVQCVYFYDVVKDL